ncbi:AAA family ATPase [Geomonas sp. Red32]|uniref:AAA family ATPase n=1 Tax=Geomonas sp. Red32 TaxID=2912856 RepID=UPI00202CDF8F|nr:AAA family ATPase [Geomonas sp. Red32]MCM0083180.1 AAA family ATPase [Geomonas sp. Red32]
MSSLYNLYVSQSSAPKPYTDKAASRYSIWLGQVLIDLALILGWYNPVRNQWPSIFTDDDFLALTGLPSHPGADRDLCDDGEGWVSAAKAPTALQSKRLLLGRRSLLRKKKLPKDLPLFSNIGLLGETLGLSVAGEALLAFAAALQLFPQFCNAIALQAEATSNQSLCHLMARITGIPAKDFAAAIADDGPLAATGILRIPPGSGDLETKLDLIDGFGEVLLCKHASREQLIRRFVRKAAPPTVSLDSFPHLSRDSHLLLDYLRNSLDRRIPGVNVLMHGKPGAGKTEYVKALAAAAGADLYEINYADPEGNPIKGNARLRAYNLCQRFLARCGNALLLFDEIEDVFEPELDLLFRLFGGEDASGGSSGGKAWLNRTLEGNAVPAVWVSNRIGHIDQAYKRRYDYSVSFPQPPKAVRLSMAQRYLRSLHPPKSFLQRIASHDELTPAQLAAAAKVARVVSPEDGGRALEIVEQTLDCSSILLGQTPVSARKAGATGYSLAFLNTDVDLAEILEGIKRRPRCSFCFYGAAGTGKSELARFIAGEVGKSFLLRRASDLLSKYVGEAEKNIAGMFHEARQQDAVLVLDEADSFLADRRGAHQSWEVSQVNEMLTQMEAFDGIFICTTNLMEKLDPASLRRFDLKVRFAPLTPGQRWDIFKQELGRLGGDGKHLAGWETRVRELGGLTPGDLAVAARRFELLGTPATAEKLYQLLRKECAVKGGTLTRIGFAV